MAKQPATIFVCQSCGGQSRKWLGQCPDCQEWNTLVEERFRPTPSIDTKHNYVSQYRQTSPIAYGTIESQGLWC